jgi:hypothetical protein
LRRGFEVAAQVASLVLGRMNGINSSSHRTVDIIGVIHGLGLLRPAFAQA